jgi:tetratricopeptide (TPR) repeat protein
VTPTAPEDRFSTARSPGDRVGPVRLVERLPAPPTEERWRATVQLAKGPPREVVAVATAAPTGGPALERWQESDGGWSATVVTSEPPPEETPGPSGPDAADVPDPAAATALGHAWLALGDGDLDRAIDLTWAATERVGRARRRYSAPLVEALAGRVGDEHPESAVVGLLRAGDLAEGGRSAEALATARAALGRRTTHAEVRGRLHYLAAVLSHRQGHLDEVEADARRAVALLDEAGAPRWAASACTALAVWAQARGDFALADEVYGGALERARRAGSREAELVVYSNRAGLLRAMGRWEDARTCLLANLSLARQLGAKASVLVALSNLAGLLLDAGQPRAARGALRGGGRTGEGRGASALRGPRPAGARPGAGRARPRGPGRGGAARGGRRVRGRRERALASQRPEPARRPAPGVGAPPGRPRRGAGGRGPG